MSKDGVFASISCISDEMTSECGLLAPKNRAIATTTPINSKKLRPAHECDPSVRCDSGFDNLRRAIMVPLRKPNQSSLTRRTAEVSERFDWRETGNFLKH
jgi:hypothetical protein